MQSLTNVIGALIADKTSGSNQLLLNLTNQLLTYFKLNNPDYNEIQSVKKLLNQLIIQLPNFPVIHHFIRQFETIDIVNASSATKMIEAYKNQWDSVNEELALKLMNEIDLNNKTVLLHSNSSAIHALLKCLKTNQIHIDIIQTESRPANEGRIQANIAAELAFQVKYITDVSFLNFIHKTDLLILGSDIVYTDKFINKTGSHLLAYTIKKHNKPVYVLSDSRKFIDSPCTFHEDRKSSKEVWNTNNSDIQVMNNYFEPVPRDLITRLFYI